MAAPKKLWHVVKFDDKQLGIVPEPWLLPDRRSCFYPKKMSTYERNSITEACKPPKNSWPVFKIVKFYNRNICDIILAKDHLMDVESETSDCNTTMDKPQKNRPPAVLPVFPNDVGNQSIVSQEPPQSVQSIVAGTSTQSNQAAEELVSVTVHVEPVPAAEPVQPAPAAEPVQPVPAAEPVQPVPAAEPVQPVPAAEPVQPVPAAEPVQPVPAAELVQLIQPNQAVEDDAAVEELLQRNPEGCRVEIPVAVLRSLVRGQVQVNRFLANMEATPQQAGPSPTIRNYDEETILGSCPFRDLRSFEKLDSKLSKSKSLRDRFRSELELLKTSDPRSSCQAMLGKLLTDSVVEKFSFTGRPNARMLHPKKPFKATCVHKCIYQVVNTCFPQNKLTAEKYKESIQGWIAQAKFRRSRREARALQRANSLLQSAEIDDDDSLSEPES